MGDTEWTWKPVLEEERKALENEYPVGTAVQLVVTTDEEAPEVGAVGRVQYVDDCGIIVVRWYPSRKLSGVNLKAGDIIQRV